MFYDTEIIILANLEENSAIKTIPGDVQPYTKSLSFEDGYEIPITQRVFCEADAAIHLNRYFLIHQRMFKVMEMKEWSDYLEIFLYECKG